MTTNHAKEVASLLARMLGPCSAERERTDGELLCAFIERRDARAFQELVRRHGPMVFGVCTRVLRHHQDAEDAFQATFLVLARKAASVSPRAAVGNWLYGVALQTAIRARSLAMKRREREVVVSQVHEPASPEEGWDDLAEVLDEELGRLPEHYRAVIVLCDVEGRTRADAARHLGCPEGSVSSRLSRARAMLARRLSNRDITLSSAALAVLVGQNATAAAPAALLQGTLKAALAAGTSLAAVSPAVVTLANGVLRDMITTKLKVALVALLALGLFGLGGAAGLGLLSGQTPREPGDEKAPEKRPGGKAVGKAPAPKPAAANGLRIELRPTELKKGAKPPTHCVVVLQNAGDADLNINLGVTLGNGTSHHPTALRLLAIEGKDTIRLAHAEPRAAGRLDPFVVPLPAGGSYTIRCALANFVRADGGGPFDFAAKNYRLRAELVGLPVTETGPDLRGLALMRFWQGTVRSE